jgi:hypothetical protein
MEDRSSQQRLGGKIPSLFQENTMAVVGATAAASALVGVGDIAAGAAANTALSAADMAAQINKKANAAAVNAI